MLEDAAGAPARFSLVTQKGNTALEKGAAFIRDELKKVGLRSTWCRSKWARWSIA